MLQGEHSAIPLTFSKLPFVIQIFVLSIFDWEFYTGCTVLSPQGEDPRSKISDKVKVICTDFVATPYLLCQILKSHTHQPPRLRPNKENPVFRLTRPYLN